jgi:hypothetical protein
MVFDKILTGATPIHRKYMQSKYGFMKVDLQNFLEEGLNITGGAEDVTDIHELVPIFSLIPVLCMGRCPPEIVSAYKRNAHDVGVVGKLLRILQ